MGRSPGPLGVFSRMNHENWWESSSFMYREGFGNKGIECFLGKNINQMEEPQIKGDDQRQEVAVS